MPTPREHDDSEWLVPAGVAAHLLIGIGTLAAAYFVVPRYKTIFEDFAVELPPAVVAIVQFSDLVVNFWYLAFLPLLIFAAVDWAILITVRSFGLRMAWIMVLALLLLCLAAFAVLTMRMTMLQLINNLR